MRDPRDVPAGASGVAHAIDPSALSEVSRYFGALSEPTRLRLLAELRAGERNVNQLAEALGAGQANISRHLSLLASMGIVEREARGTCAFYRIADQVIFELCDLVCDRLATRFSGLLAASRTTGKPLAGKGATRRGAATVRRGPVREP